MLRVPSVFCFESFTTERRGEKRDGVETDEYGTFEIRNNFTPLAVPVLIVFKLSGRAFTMLYNHGAQAALVVLAVLGIFLFNNWFLEQFDALGDLQPVTQDPDPPRNFTGSIRDFVNEYFSVYAKGGSRSYAELQKLYEDVVTAGEEPRPSPGTTGNHLTF